MALNKARLDRFLAQYCQISRKNVRLILAQNRVFIDGIVAHNIDEVIDTFSLITLDGKVIQENSAYYIMLNKPTGVVSATSDTKHKTVIDLLDYPFKHELHIVGRLDLNTSGLVLLTNDSRWSERLTLPDKKVAKRYKVTLQNPLNEEYIAAFAKGMYFAFEDLTTKPAKLTILSDYQAKVELIEGRYHQIKRMFGRFRNPVKALHRCSIGNLQLDSRLDEGQSRKLTQAEINNIDQ
ncbi:pseudouridine synthase [Cognaticolwellia beringensis]|uniref:Pseudouridine synthase n=1 Tax=Cognaticolwellia beringensis TaxID=1967665 RepID=A0A222G3E4_9GAMM|nr:16S rRNA pseudouridine(516) synthase [Cognaticolwellia beringensis]ASP46445.1 16S rRNA pseudouridine(516) synthase [Cognaticolwellia beringensis]